jgi:ASC-1-like (ASCH) protein
MLITIKNIYIKEKAFNQILSGKKTIEGRLFSKFFSNINVNDYIYFINNNQKILCKITIIDRFETFINMLKNINISNINPGSKSLEDSINIYLKTEQKPYGIYTPEMELKNGVIAIHFEKK